MIGKTMVYFIFLCFIQSSVIAQIYSGKIVYERKTNLYKKYKSEKDIKEWIKEEDKTKTDIFELYFTDTVSVFKPQEGELREKNVWATSKNTVYQNFKSNLRLSIKPVWGEPLYIKDTLYKREWKITDNKRSICGYDCRKAIWQANDTTRIYAWYADDIVPGVGPESFYGLPGAMLGLATEDGGVIYFAKSVEMLKPDEATLSVKVGKNKLYDPSELKTKLQKDFGKYKWGKIMLTNLFGVW